MNMEWLKDQDADFFKNRLRECFAQLMLCQKNGLKADAAAVQEKIARLISIGKVPPKEVSQIEVDVRVCQAEISQAFSNPAS